MGPEPPSLAEGFGLVAVEAQACGAPVVASAASALPEAVGDAGILAAPTDTASWSGALRRLVRDPVQNADYRSRALARWSTVAPDANLRAFVRALEGPFDDRA